MKRVLAAVMFLWISLEAPTGDAWAQGTLTKIIVPVAPGGAPDIVARLIAGPLSARLGHTVIVEDRPGAGERIGAEIVAQAPPDGQTLLLAPPGSLVLAQALFSNLRYKPEAFTSVGTLTSSSLVLLVRENLGASTVRQLIALATQSPRKLTYASPGIGTPPHLTGEMFRLAAGVEFTHVPYKGLAPALADLLAGRVDFMFDNLGNSLPNIKAGRVKVLAVAGDHRIPELPDIPALTETYPSVQASSWFGVVAPPNTPESVRSRLSAALAEIVRSPEVEKRLRTMGLQAVGSSPAEMAEMLKVERARWAAVVKDAHITAE